MQHFPDQTRVESKTIAQAERKRQHPLPDRHFEENPVHKMGGGVSHATAAARRAKSSTLARKGNDLVLAAVVTVNTQEAVGQDAALKEGSQLAFHEPGHVAIPPVLPLEDRADWYLVQGSKYLPGAE